MTFAREPDRERPASPLPSYGVPETGGALVAWSHVVDRLTAATAYWLATVTPAGRPHVVPIWGVAWADGGLVRVDPRSVLAWRDMPTATRWRLDARQSTGPAEREPA